MVAKASKECRVPYCHNLTNNSNGYCDAHKSMARISREDKYDKFYRTSEWINKRVYIINRDYGVCLRCLSKGKTVDAAVVHHIVELKDCWNMRLFNNNLISLCPSCHKQVHDRYKENSLSKRIEQKDLQKILREFLNTHI